MHYLATDMIRKDKRKHQFNLNIFYFCTELQTISQKETDFHFYLNIKLTSSLV